MRRDHWDVMGDYVHLLFRFHKPVWRDVPVSDYLTWRVCTVCRPRHAKAPQNGAEPTTRSKPHHTDYSRSA